MFSPRNLFLLKREFTFSHFAFVHLLLSYSSRRGNNIDENQGDRFKRLDPCISVSLVGVILRRTVNRDNRICCIIVKV